MSRLISSLIALAVALIGIHLLYIGYIRPDAALVIEIAKQAGQSAPRALSESA